MQLDEIPVVFVSPAEPPQPEGSKQCPDPNGRYRDARNCSVFHVCVNGSPIKFDCPLGTVYSEVIMHQPRPYLWLAAADGDVFGKKIVLLLFIQRGRV